MSATKSKPTSINEIVVAHRQRARDLVLAYARGEEVSPEEFIAIAQQSGKGVYWLQTLAETVAKGKQLFDEHKVRDWNEEIQKSIDDYREAVKAVDLANAAAEEARKACREASERSQSLLDLRQHLIASRDKAGNDYRKAMTELGVDADDWTQFSMA
jgi:predicted molibdopterin-dependent oxidoreductase YjgC